MQPLCSKEVQDHQTGKTTSRVFNGISIKTYEIDPFCEEESSFVCRVSTQTSLLK